MGFTSSRRWMIKSYKGLALRTENLNLNANATSSPGRRMSPNPMTLYPPHGSNMRGILSNIGTPSSPLLSPRATYEVWTRKHSHKHWRTHAHQKIMPLSMHNLRIILTTIITLSWNKLLDANTQKMSYKKAQPRSTVPTWFSKDLVCKNL